MNNCNHDLPLFKPDAFKPMKVLVACEWSGTVRDAFNAKGHDAWSCDLLPCEKGSNKHITGDVRDIINDGWDFLIVAHPPCTRLCNSGIRWLFNPPNDKTLDQIWEELDEAALLFSDLLNASVDRICIENPVMHKYGKEKIKNYVEYSQSIQPYEFGHPESKKTCLWLKNLSTLKPTNNVKSTFDNLPKKERHRIHYMSPNKNRSKERSRFYTGIATAMADQWG